MNFEPLEIPVIRNYQLADYQYEIIVDQVKNFEENLNDNEEIALNLTHFGQNILMNVTDIGYSNPSLIHYYGYINGKYSELIQHVSQINFLLSSVAKEDSSKPAKRIGFKLASQEFID